MLKVWKERWKDGSRKAPIGGSDITASELESNGADLPTGDSFLDTETASVSVPSKRQAENANIKHTSKKPKKSHTDEKRSNSHSFADSPQARQVLEMALQENVLFAAPDHPSAVGILEHYISSVFEDANVARFGRRPLVVIDGPVSLANHLQAMKPYVGVVECSDPELNLWEKLLVQPNQNVVLIDSSSLLRHLTRCWVKLAQLSSVVIADLPHHVDDACISHPVFRIIRNFYAGLDGANRPLLLAGLFASRDFCSNVTFDSLNLEATVYSRIYGLSAEKRAECLSPPSLVKEVIVRYDPPLPLSETRLAQQIFSLNLPERMSRPLLRGQQHVLAELGTFAADLAWKQGKNTLGHDALPKELYQLIHDWQYSSLNLEMNSPGFNVTPKLLKLVQILKTCEGQGDAFRGIIFVHRQVVAYMMEQILLLLSDQLGFLRPAVVTSAHSAETFSQNESLRQFRTGSYNLLIATRSIEDLDIPKASIIIGFNLYDSQISQAYTRSHCREDGHLVSFAERGNSAQFNIMSRLTHIDPRVRSWTDALRLTPQGCVPRTILDESNDQYVSDEDLEDRAGSVYIKDPTTSAKLTPKDAVGVMSLIASTMSLPPNEAKLYEPLFEFDVQDDTRYICRVIAPTLSAWSSPGSTKANARRLASYSVCVDLHENGLLEHRLFSTSSGIQGGQALPPIDTDSVGTRHYDKQSPAFWSNSASTSSGSGGTRLYPIVLSVESGTTSVPYHAPIVLLTRLPLPDLPTFRVFFAGLPSNVTITRAVPFTVNEHQLRDIDTYTNRLWRGILNKPYFVALEQVMIFCAPLDAGWSPEAGDSSSLPVVHTHISWDLVTALVAGWIVPLRYANAETLIEDTKDALIQDRWTQFTRRYDAVRVRSDLSPLSKPLDAEHSNYENLVAVCKAHRKDFEGLKDYDQPLIEVSQFPSFVDRLNPAARPFTMSTTAHRYFIPELCAKVTVPASTFRTALVLPCIMRRIDDFLLVKELNAGLFSHRILEHLLHAAISTASAGIEYDYERLELLGDSFLKYLSSLYVFVTHPKADEGSMHNYRQSIISNISLLHNAVSVGLPAFIQSRPFTLKGWNPSKSPAPAKTAEVDGTMQGSNAPVRIAGERSTMSASLVDKTPVSVQHTASPGSSTQGRQRRPKEKYIHRPGQRLGDKAIADVAEAIMGAAYLSGGRDAGLKAAKALNLLLPGIEQWSDFGRKAVVSSASVSTRIDQCSVEAVEGIIGYRFKQPQILAQALTHITKSGVDSSSSYECLEFIGDAILDFMVVQHVFHRYQRMSPGGLTLLKGAMVSNSTLAAVCVWSGLHRYPLFESAHLAHDINQYASLLKRKQNEEYSIAEKEDRPVGQYWLNLESPKVLSDIVESILGAVYVSDGYSPVGAGVYFDKVFKPFYDRHITLQTVSHQPTKVLFELFQAKGCQEFQIVKEGNAYLVLVHDVILASCQDEVGVSAAKLVAALALDALEGGDPISCDCRSKLS